MTKKFLIIFTLFSCFTKPIIAQADYHFGFQASPSFSWLTNDNPKINGNGSLLGLKLGLIVEKRFSDNYSLMTGVAFHFNSGGKLIYDLPGNYWGNSAANATIPYRSNDTFQIGTELKYNLKYIEIPIGLKMRTQEFGPIRYFAEPALYFDFRADAKGTITGSPHFDQEKINISNDVGFLNISWALGIGVEYTIATNTTLIGGIYFQQGLIDIQKDSNKEYTSSGAKADASKAVINAITFKCGIMF